MAGKLPAPPVRKYLVRIGESVLSLSGAFQQLMFETTNVSGMDVAIQAFSSLLALRRTTAIVMADELRIAPENIPSCSEKPSAWRELFTKRVASTLSGYACLPSCGTTVFQGIDESMTKELTTLAPQTMFFEVVAPPVRW